MNITSVRRGDIVQIDGQAYGKVLEKVKPTPRSNARLKCVGLTGVTTYPLLTANRITGVWHRSKHSPMPH